MDEFNLAEYLAILKRWKNYFLATALSLFFISMIVTFTWSTYRSTATISIEQPQVAPIGVSSNSMSQELADLRVNKIAQKVTSPSSLIEIIKKLNLYPDAQKSTPIAEIAKNMAKKVKLVLISNTVANPAASSKVSADQLSAIAFTLSFAYSDPQGAREANSEIVTRILDEDLKQRRLEAEATSEFLENQIKTIEASLADQEKAMAKFQDENGISGPASLMFNQQAAASTAMSLQSLESQIAANEGTQGSVRAQLVSVDPYSRVLADGQLLSTPAIQLKALEAQLTTLNAQYGPGHPDVIKTSRQIEALRKVTGTKSNNSSRLKAKIRDAETNLAAGKKRLGQDHPNVIALTKQLSTLRSELSEAKNNGSSELSPKQDADNPAYLALVSQLDALEEQRKSLVKQRATMAEQKNKYEAAVARNPQLEQQMAILSRDHENSKLRHRELKERKMAADMDLQMIKDRKGQHLAVIAPPDLPLNTSPRKTLLFIGGLFLSLFGGLATVVLMQLLNQSIFGARQLAKLVGVAPLVIIPHIYTVDEKIQSPLHIASRIFKAFLARMRNQAKSSLLPGER